MFALALLATLVPTAHATGPDWLEPVRATVEQFHQQQIATALADYSNVLAGFAPNAPTVQVHVDGYGARDKLFSATVRVDVQVPFKCATAESGACLAGPHPLAECTYRDATMALHQTSDIICVPSKQGPWDCRMERRDIHTECDQQPEDLPSQCAAYSTLLGWGQLPQMPGFHDGLVDFVSKRLAAPPPAPAAPAAPAADTARVEDD